MTENEGIVEQKEHVSDNPELNKQDTEHAISSKGAVIEQSSEEPPKNESKSDDEITPHEHATETINSSDVKTPEQVARNEGTLGDVKIDFDQVELDKDGIPVFTSSDASRLRSSEMVFTNFEMEIEDARDIIKEAREALNIDNQNTLEESYKKEIDKAKKELESEADEEKKKKLNDDIKVFTEAITNLPKYNKKVQYAYEQKELSAKKHIATYQNISRVDLRKLQNDGTIAGLISSTANTAFLQGFVDFERRFKNLTPIDQDPSLKEFERIRKEKENNYEIGENISKAFDELKSVNIKFLVNHAKELKDPNNKFSENLYKEVNQDTLSNVPQLLENIGYSNSEESKTVYEDLKTSLVSLGDSELQEIKDRKALENKYIDDYEKTFGALAIINNAYPVFKSINKIEDKFERIGTKIDDKTDADELLNKIDSIEKLFSPKWEIISKEYEENENKLNDAKNLLIKPIKDYICSYGLFNSFIVFSQYASSFRGYYARSESLFEFQHIINYAEAFYSVIKMNMSNNEEDTYNTIKNNVNSVSMNFNNIIRYFCNLYDNDVDLEWSAGFDPDSVLKNFYNEYKESIDKFIKEYKESISVLSHVLCHNSKMFEKYTTFISDTVDYINQKQIQLKKIDEGKKIKNKYKIMTDIAFAYQFIQSYSAFSEEIKELNDAVTAKKKENLSAEEFDKWYKDNWLKKEHMATSRVISSLLHLSVGCNIIYAFSDFDSYFKDHNNNKALRHDALQYLFNEYILESLAFRNCPNDQTYAEYIKAKSKGIAFQSIDYTFQRDVDINKARAETVALVFTYAINIFRSVINDICGREENKNEIIEVKEDKSKNKKNKKDLQQIYKEKSKEKKKLIGSYKHDISIYNNIIRNAHDSNTIELESEEDKFCIRVCPFKDTKVIIRVERYTKKIPENSISFFEKNTIDSNIKTIDIEKAYTFSKSISNESLSDLQYRLYYNQFVEGIKDEFGVSLIYKQLSTITDLYERCKYILNYTLKYSYDKIIEKAIEIIKKTGIDFTNKSIAIKNNCKFDIKWFKNKNLILEHPEENGNLNFFQTNFWEIITYELNYDIINTNKK